MATLTSQDLREIEAAKFTTSSGIEFEVDRHDGDNWSASIW